MTMSAATSQTVTTASGTVAIATTSTSIGVAKVIHEAPADAQAMLDMAHTVITTADMIGMFSATVMTMSFAYSVYVSRKKAKLEKYKVELDAKFYALRLEELEIEKIKQAQCSGAVE